MIEKFDISEEVLSKTSGLSTIDGDEDLNIRKQFGNVKRRPEMKDSILLEFATKKIKYYICKIITNIKITVMK